MWTVVIIILVIAMMVGPVMMMQPSTAQKRLVVLRQMAQQNGLQINVSTYTTFDGLPCWFYWQRLPEKHTLATCTVERKNYDHGLHVEGVWAPKQPINEPSDAFKALLRALPDSVMAVEVNAHVVGLHWSERGGEKTLATLTEALTTFSQS